MSKKRRVGLPKQFYATQEFHDEQSSGIRKEKHQMPRPIEKIFWFSPKIQSTENAITERPTDQLSK